MAINAETAARNAEIVALHKKGWTLAKLAKKFDLSNDSTYRLLRSLGRDALANENKETTHSAPKSAAKRKTLKKAA